MSEAAPYQREGVDTESPSSARIGVFISYRRDDVGVHCAALLANGLAQCFGKDNVFCDVKTLKRFAGVPYEEVIEKALDLSDVEIVLIGDKWATDDNLRRLEDKNDLHRREIEGAFARKIEVIPVVVEKAGMPEARDLPPALARLPSLQDHGLAVDDWDHDVETLIEAVERLARERRDRIELERLEQERAKQEARDRVFMSEAEERAQRSDFEGARQAAALIKDRGRGVEALVGIARAQAEAGASQDAIATLDSARELTPEIEDGRARAQARALVEVERQERVRELIRRAREEAQAGSAGNARAILDSARAAAEEIEGAAAREEALSEVVSAESEIVGTADTGREEHVRELVSRAREFLKAGAAEDAQATLGSARVAAQGIEDAERRSAALALVADVDEEVRAWLEAEHFQELMSRARARLEAGADEEAQAILDSAKEAGEQIKDTRAREDALSEVAKAEGEIAEYEDAEREKHVRELVSRARELLEAEAIEESQATLDSARATAQEIEDAERQGAALALVAETEEELLGPSGCFRAATRITGASGSIRGDNTAATKEPGEPEHAGNAGGRSVWYRWTAPAGGAATIDTVGSDFDTLLAVYRGSSLGDLELVEENDDTDGTQSRVRFPITEGAEYLIAVDGYDGAAGAIVLKWEIHETGQLTNDDFSAAEEIAGASGTIGGDNTAATKEPGEPDHAGNAGDKSVWYRWTAPAGGAATIDTVGSDFDTLLAVYRGSSLAELEPVAANDDADGRQSRVRFPIEEGSEYMIAVDGYGGAAGAIVLNWEVQETGRLTAQVQATGLRFTEVGGGAVTVPFSGEHAGQVVVNAKELGDGVAFFCVDLPQFTGFGMRFFLKTLLNISHAADYVKAISLSGDLFALAAEIPATALTPPICEGLIRSLVALGDVTSQSDLRSGWNRRLENCTKVQDLHIRVDPERAREEMHAMLERAGLSSGLPGRYELNLGLKTRPLFVHLSRRVISLMVTLQGVRPGRDTQKLRGLLDLNRAANVAKVGLDSHGDVTLLYEVPQVVPDLMERVKPQLASLHARVSGIV